MQYRNRIRVCVLVAAALCYTIIHPAAPLRAQEKGAMHAPDALPGVEPAMLTPDYWIALHDDAGDIIMTAQEIEAFNAEHRANAPDGNVNDEGIYRNTILPLDRPATMPGAELRDILDTTADRLMNPPELYGSRQFYDGRNVTWDDRMKSSLIAAMAVDDIPGTVTRRWGIVVNHTDIRLYPTDVPGYHNTETELDRFQVTDLLTGNPVAVLHRSADGDWLYCESMIARGWIAARDIALAPKDEVRKLAEPSSFLVAVEDRVPLYSDPSFTTFRGYLFFGGTVPLERKTDGGWVVTLPLRTEAGFLATATGYIRPDAHVNEGWVPYSKRNLLTNYFRLLHTPYGWHGQDGKRDCAGTLRVLFRSFGIHAGRAVWTVPGIQHEMPADLPMDEKMARAREIEGIITIAYGPGHVVLFLGEAGNGKLYFMHQCGWGYNDENGVHRYVNRVVINEASHPLYTVEAPTLYTVVR